MGKGGRSKNKATRSGATLPKGIPQKGRSGSDGLSPFETARATSSRVKHHVHNRVVPGQKRPSASGGGRADQSSLARAVSLRKTHLEAQIAREGKANEFVDRRIGEAARNNEFGGPTKEEVMLRRIVQERARRSKRRGRFSLEDEDDDMGMGLTHMGKSISENYTGAPSDHRDVHLSDEDGDDLDRVDTMLHFGGGRFDKDNSRERGAYGGRDGDMGRAYRSRKEELEEMIMRKKMEKAEKMKRKEDQEETLKTMDESFSELAKLLQFRDKEQERVKKAEARKSGTLSQEDAEMDAWDREMKGYLFERKVAATDRTKTSEELAKEEAERLHALESKRLARMSGDFLSDDEFSDVSEDCMKGKRRKRGEKGGVKKKRKRSGGHSNPEEVSDSDDDRARKEEGHEVCFTADGLVYVDRHGKVMGKVGDEQEDEEENRVGSEDDSSEDEDEDEDESSDIAESLSDDFARHDLGGSSDEASANGSSGSDDNTDTSSSDSEDADTPVELKEGMAVQGNFRANEQYGKKQHWYDGKIMAVRKKGNVVTYDVAYNDGDFEEGMAASNVRPIAKSKEEKRQEEANKKDAVLKKKKQKAKLKAKESIPYVFEVPTTLGALHDLIAAHASTGADASLIVQRVYATNSVRLNHKNKEKMQNFYDVVLRRFMAVGDAIFASGDGGPALGRYEQLNSLTKILYAMSQDSPECAGAVWSRRLGTFQKALSKRLRDVEVTPLGDACDNEFTAWPSTGLLLLMRALPHVFPFSDKRHAVATPAIILLGQILAQTPIKTRHDVVMGLFCAGVMLEYTKGAKRLPPETMAYLAGVLRLFADDAELAVADGPMPSLSNAFKCPQLMSLRSGLSKSLDSNTENIRLSVEKDQIKSDTNPLAIVTSTLHLTQQAFRIIGKSDAGSEKEIFGEISKSLLLIKGKAKDYRLPQAVKSRLAETAQIASDICAPDDPRKPLQCRKAPSVKELAIKPLTPRIEDPSRYSMSKDKGKSQLQAEHDRNRREYSREHKAAMRELRFDSAFVESERRKTRNEADAKARERRHKNFAWLEQEQATVNQQVRLGGGLLSGGGIGAAKAKAQSRKMGMKKGGKF